MHLLIIGGTGLISSEIARVAHAAGNKLTLVTRGRSAVAPPPAGAEVIHADATDADALGTALGDLTADAVIQSVAFTPEHVARDVDTFAGRAGQYIFISTAAAYRTFGHLHLLREDDEQRNDLWEYARLKADAESTLRERADAAGLPWTVVRPAHTYGPSKIPSYTGNARHPWTVVDRMRRGADILIPGDGTSLWTLTHAADVAAGIVSVAGLERAHGQAVHITTDTPVTWNTIMATIADAAGLSPEQFAAQRVSVPTDALVARQPELAGSLYGDKMHPAAYDTSRIRDLVPGWGARIPLADGMAEAIEWFEADPTRRSIDHDANAMLDRMCGIYRDALATAAT